MLGTMTKRLVSLLALTAVLSGLSACKMTEEDPSEKAVKQERQYPVHFVADEIETKTAFTDAETSDGKTLYPTLWTANDSKIAVSLNLGGAKGAAVTPSADFKSATFDADFSASEVVAPYTFYALSPFSALVGASSSHGGFHFSIPATQTPLEGSCDEAAQVMAASSAVESIADFSSVKLHFSHVTAYGKLTLKNMVLPEGATVQSIDLTASTPFAGQFYYKFEDGSLEESASSRTVTLTSETFAVDASGNLADLWFACAPADLGGGTLKVDVNTSAGVLSRTVDVPAGGLAFSSGKVSNFGVNMSSAEFTQTEDRWVLVTDSSTLKAGDEIIIANSATVGAAYAISTTQNTNYRGYTAVSIAKDTDGQTVLQNPSSTVEHFILVAGTGTYSSCFRLKDATNTTEGYLAATNSGSNNYLLTANNNNTYDNWVITITTQATHISTYGTVRNSGSSYYRHIRFNSDRFATYRSSSRTSWNSSTAGTKGPFIYRKDTGINPESDPIVEMEEYGAYLSGNNRVYGAGCQISREYMEDGTVSFAILSPATYEIAEFNGIPVNPAKGDNFTLNYNLITGRNQSDTDYNVTVVKVDGPKVWLSAGSGNGFIVKK